MGLSNCDHEDKDLNPLSKIRNVFKHSTEDINVPLSALKTGYYHARSKKIFADHNTHIHGLNNIDVNGSLILGRGHASFSSRFDKTFLKIDGQLIVNGEVRLGRGCRLTVEKSGICVLNQCTVTGYSHFVIGRRLEIGEGTLISWGCEFLDEDWHTIDYPGRREKPPEIMIGRDVWIGSRVQVLKGVRIGDGAVVGASAVVTRSVPPRTLVAGNPAQVIRTDVTWR